MVDDYSRSRVPQYHELFNPTLGAIRTLGGSASNSEIANRVIEDMRLPDAITQLPHGRGNLTELEYRLFWARTYLKQFGVIDNSERGIWSFTESGTEIGHVEPSDVVEYVRQRHRRPDKVPETEEEDLLADVSPIDADSWRETLSETLLNMPPPAFERLCQRLLRESGFIEVEVTGQSGDGGIDGRGIIRFAGLISFPVLFQCKRYSGNVGPSVVRDLRGAMQGRADRGLILTTGGFTRDAHMEATRDGAPPIDLIDGELLIDKLKELRLGVRVAKIEIEEVTIDTKWFNSI